MESHLLRRCTGYARDRSLFPVHDRSRTNQVFQKTVTSPTWANSVARLKSRLPGLIGWKSQRGQTREKTRGLLNANLIPVENRL